MIKLAAIGIDGGGTKTDAVLVSGEGEILARAIGGPSNYQDIGAESAQTVYRGLVDQLVSDFNASHAADLQVGASAWGLSGWDRPRDEEVLRPLVHAVDVAPSDACDIVNDTFLILRSGATAGAGVAVVSGTGSNCVGIAFDGARARIGGHAFEFGDAASGTDIGRDGLRAAFRGADGRAPQTLITDLLCDRYALARIDDVFDFFIADTIAERGAPEVKLGDLALLVFDAANLGDSVATDILTAAGRELATSARTLARDLFSTSSTFPLVMGGSVLRRGSNPSMREALLSDMNDEFPNVFPAVPTAPPVLGAALLALDTLRKRHPDSVDDPAELARHLESQLGEHP